jgi:signal peptidase I
MNYRWFISRTVRHATTLRKHIRHTLDAQRDILSPQAAENVSASLGELDKAIHSNIKKDDLFMQMQRTDEVADKWLKKYPNANWRENIEVFLVAVAVAMGIRTFFVQPFKIPTGSMQPTLYGITSKNLINEPVENIPTGFARVREWFEGNSYIQIKAKSDGRIERVNNPVGIRIINFYQTFYLGGVAHHLFMPPDFGSPPLGTLQARAGWISVDRLGYHPTEQGAKTYKKGDVVARFKVQAGDHLFVDRLTYNFRKPKRGEIVVFGTAGISEEQRRPWNMPDDQFYIKRMVALANEKVRIGEDHHIVIDGKRLDETTPHFENVYAPKQVSTDPDNLYAGTLPIENFANGEEIQVRSNHFMVMGDNTGNSLDSRFFGDIDSDYIIGKQFLVYWPLSKRFGWNTK